MAKKITQSRDRDNKFKIENGRIDKIANDCAIIDGKRVKLKSGSKIKGVNGYKKSFTSVNELLVGDIVNLEGYYDADGSIYASSFEVEPDMESEYDEAAKEGIDKLHDYLYPRWIDKTKRKELFGVKISDGIVITNNEILQDYVNTIGMKLVPDYLKGEDSKIKFMFILIDSEEWNACVLPNGLSFVNWGLLIAMQNDAQLAAVLGHEIAHAIYEHGAKRQRDMARAQKKEEKRNKLKSLYDKVIPNIPMPTDPTNSTQRIRIDTEITDVLLKDLPTSILYRKLSEYSIEEESQADRVGLSLLVDAGYDPREATTVWRNAFNNSPHKPLKSQSFFDNTVNDVSQAKRPTPSTVAFEIIKSVATTKSNNNLLAGRQTHPENLKRFENLHDMISLFWSSSAIIDNSTTGFDNWLATWERVIEAAKKN